jgi:hypothetical protein
LHLFFGNPIKVNIPAMPAVLALESVRAQMWFVFPLMNVRDSSKTVSAIVSHASA